MVKNIGYNVLKEKLRRLWRLAGGFEMLDVDNGFYIVKFDFAADKENVATEGPWMIFLSLPGSHKLESSFHFASSKSVSNFSLD